MNTLRTPARPRPRWASLASYCVLVLVACGPSAVVPTTESADTTTASTSIEDTTDGSGPVSTSTGESTSTSAPIDEDGSGNAFVPTPDVPDLQDCDLFAQDCPPGYKCNAWASGSNPVWNEWGCFALVEQPDAVGEPCTVEDSPVSGSDSCDIGSICWDVDNRTLEGVCVPYCSGDLDLLFCEDPERLCAVSADAITPVCLPSCDPLADDCPEDRGCYWFSGGFFCGFDGSGPEGAPGDGCMYINACDPGTLCTQPDQVPTCIAEESGCCTSFCDLEDESPPCLDGQQCLPLPLDSFEVLPGFEHLGLCGVP